MGKLFDWDFETYRDEQLTLEEYIIRVHDLMDTAVEHLRDMEGDMYLSDYRNVCIAEYKLQHLVGELKKIRNAK